MSDSYEAQRRAAFAAALGDIKLKPRLLPHQIAPPGDWYGWVLLGGRGAGKTQACSSYINNHVNGPACLPGPNPHWIGIIAPTLGDAVTSCVNGPSGLKQYDPTLKLAQTMGGATVRWSNGSEAKLFGAREPEDRERLRSGGNRSAQAGTLIRTERGQVPIEQVHAGERVWTRNGLRTVLISGSHGIRQIWKLVTAQGTLYLTGDHEVATPEGDYVRVDKLRVGSKLLAWNHISNMTGFDGISVKKVTTPTRNADYSTDIFGHSTTDPSQKVCMCTTYSRTIGIQQTSHDLLHIRQKSIHPYTQEETSLNQIDMQLKLAQKSQKAYDHRKLKNLERQLVSFVEDQSKAHIEIHSTAMRIGAGRIDLRNELVQNAEIFLPQLLKQASPWNAANTVATLANGEAAVIMQHTKNGCALCAVTRSPPTYENPPELALTTVVDVQALKRANSDSVIEREVFDLTIEHDHEFFANDVLVGNCVVWAEELAAWRYLADCWDQMRFGLRVGPRPHWVASTTPKPKKLIKQFDKGEVANVVVTRATTFDNPHLPKDIRDALEETYGGQQLGAQELYARIIEQDENALFTRANIEKYRVKDIADVPDLKRITVGVDPSGGAGEQGIVVVGLHILNEMIPQGPGLGAKLKTTKTGYVLDDRTVRLPPAEWGRRVVQAYLDWEADDVVVERNFGGDMAKATIVGAAEAMGVTISVKEVVASRGKRVRAEPVAALASRGQWRFVGTHPELEDQLCVWTPEADYSPDRLDAMVWPAWHMKIATAMQLVGASFPGQQMAQERIAPT